LPKKEFETLLLNRNEGEKAMQALNRNPRLRRSEIYGILSPLPSEILLFLMAKTNQEPTRKAISLYFTQLKAIRLSIGGDDLNALGLEPGPHFKVILKTLMEARLNGKVLTPGDEIAYVREHFLNPVRSKVGEPRPAEPTLSAPGKG
jgi:tRNA nucleotidyltransferase (CCA-adding enzyme)